MHTKELKNLNKGGEQGLGTWGNEENLSTLQVIQIYNLIKNYLYYGFKNFFNIG